MPSAGVWFVLDAESGEESRVGSPLDGLTLIWVENSMGGSANGTAELATFVGHGFSLSDIAIELKLQREPCQAKAMTYKNTNASARRGTAGV